MLGEIFLYDYEGEEIKSRPYHSVKERKQIVARWEIEKDTKDTIHICPHHNARGFVEALYSNIPTYDYNQTKNGHGH